MRKLDLLIIKAFIGPFVLTTALSTFILLIQHMLKYFEDFVGKDLGFMVFAKLLFYFSLNMLQVALPLGVLVSSLMTFGNLGEHFELTAIKSSGISLVRALRPMFLFVAVISIAAFFFNDKVLPVANLKAYSLLYDIKHKKPTLDIQEGVFYRGLPNYTIKAREKFADDKTLKDVIIYDHSGPDMGNRRVILADSARMFSFMNDRYLKLELFNGNYYSEARQRANPIDQFYRTSYDRMDLVFSLASFEFDPTDDELFRGNRQMMDIAELTTAIDSMETRKREINESSEESTLRFYAYFKTDERRKEPNEIPYDSSLIREKRVRESNRSPRDTFDMKPTMRKSFESQNPEISRSERVQKDRTEIGIKSVDVMISSKSDSIAPLILDSLRWVDLDSIVTNSGNMLANTAAASARNLKNTLSGTVARIESIDKQLGRYSIEKYKKYSQAFACIVMFFIGAPLGAIIKKGGLGVPVIISIFFFIVYYVLSISGEEYAKAGVMDGRYSVWIANVILLPIGMFFLRQARIDARLFDKDIYIIWWDRMMEKYWKRKKIA